MVKGDLTILQDPASPRSKIWVILEVEGTAYIAYGGTVGGYSRSGYTKTIAMGRSMLQKKRAEYPLSWDQSGILVDDSRTIADGADKIIHTVFSTFQRRSGSGVEVPDLLVRLVNGQSLNPPEPAPAPDLSASLGSIIPEATWIF